MLNRGYSLLFEYRKSMLVLNEKKFRQWWIWLTLMAMGAFMVFGIYRNTMRMKPIGNNPANETTLT